MNCCACLLLYALLLSCSDACGLKVGMSPGPAFGRITSRNNLLNGIASGIGPGPHQCSHRKTKGTVLSNGLSRHHCYVGLGFRRWLCRAPLHHRRRPDGKFLSLNRWRKPSGVLSRNWAWKLLSENELEIAFARVTFELRGKTAKGRATVAQLKMNIAYQVEARKLWVEL